MNAIFSSPSYGEPPAPDPVVMDFARAITEARRIRGLLKIELAAKITLKSGKPMSPQYLQDIENGTTKPRADYLINQFANVLGVNADYLFYLANRWPPDVRTPALSEPQFQIAMNAFRSCQATE